MGIMLNLAVGDAYGAAFEYAEPAFVEANNDALSYKPHPKFPNRTAATYTDDTQMSLAIVELMLADSDWSAENIANKFVEVFKRDERTGYARKFYAFLKDINSGDELRAKLVPESDRSGGAMRACPIGLYPSTARVIAIAKSQAQITHATESGMEAAVVAALMTHYFAYSYGPKANLAKWIQNKVNGSEWETPYVGPVGEKGWMAVRAAITAISECDSMSSLLKRCISFTGDVDTVATIALAAATYCPEIKQDLDPVLFDTLENGTYGRDYLLQLDEQLKAKFPNLT